MTKVQEELARSIAKSDLEKFQKDLAELGAKITTVQEPEKKAAARAEAVAAVEKFTKERALPTGGSTEFHDQFTMGGDPGLKVLRDRAAGPHGGAADLIQFGRRFFFEVDPLNRSVPKATEGLFAPKPYPAFDLTLNGTEPAFLVWRTDEQEASTPRDFNAPGVKAKVESAWREMKARELARKAAEELAKASDKLGDSQATIFQKLMDQKAEFAAKFSDESAKGRIKYHEISDVAPLTNQTLPMAGREMVMPFVLAPSAEIPFPTPQMTVDLLQTRQKPLSSSVVLVDQPEDRFYVATLLNKQERSPEEFGLTVYGSPLFGDMGQAISRRHQAELMRDARAQAIALLKEELRYSAENTAILDKRSEPIVD